MEIPLYEYDYGIIKCRAEGWKSDYNNSRSLYSAVNYAYCIYCMCVNLSCDDTEKNSEITKNSEEIGRIYNNISGFLRLISKKARLAYDTIACYYGESLMFSAENAEYDYKIKMYEKIENLYKKHGKNLSTAYAGILENIISYSNKNTAFYYMNILEKLYNKEKSYNVEFYYTSAIMKTINYYDIEKVDEYIEILKNIKEKSDNCKINYYFALSNLAYKKGFKEGKKYIDILIDEYKTNDDIEPLEIYAFTMRNIICKSEIEEAVSLTEILGDIYFQTENENIANEYIFSLFRLTEEVKKPYIEKCVNQIKELYYKFPNDEHAFLYGRGLFNLFFETGTKKGFYILDEIYDLYNKTKDKRIAIEYAKGLFNTSANVKDMDFHKEAFLKLKHIYEKSKYIEILKEYTMALLNCVYRGEKQYINTIRDISYKNDLKFIDNILKCAEKYTELKGDLFEEIHCKDVDNIKYKVILEENSIVYSFENYMDIHLIAIDDSYLTSIKNIDEKLLYIVNVVSENIELIKKLTFIDRYGYRFLDDDLNFYGDSICFKDISFDDVNNWITAVSVHVFCKYNEVYSIEVDFEENELANKDKLFGSGDWVRPKNFSSEGFYIKKVLD